MKPTGPVARRADYDVRPIEHAVGAALIIANHYARGCSNTGIMHGLFRRAGDALVGVAHWLPPTRVCAESVSREAWRDVLSLTRLVVIEGQPRNCASMLIARSIHLLPARWSWLVTFADESQGHTGTIYRASGWEYRGRTKPEPRWVDPTGRQVARKAGKNSRTAAEMLALGYRLDGRFAKHKFVKSLRKETA